MSLIVQKFGGTSVANADRINAVAERVARYKKEGHQIIVVVSAMSGETNKLIGLAEEMMETPDSRERCNCFYGGTGDCWVNGSSAH